MAAHIPIGGRLLQAHLVDQWQLQSALAFQRTWGGRLGEVFVKMGFLSEQVVFGELARQLDVQYVEIGDRMVPSEVIQLVPPKLIWRRKILPVAHIPLPRPGLLFVATSEPQDLAVLDEVAFATGKRVRSTLVSERDLERAIARHLEPPGGALNGHRRSAA